jgi:acylphosphatase
MISKKALLLLSKREIRNSKIAEMNKCFSFQVFGQVQGVWFRKSTQEKAIELGLNGMVKNLTDGSVYIEVEGPEENLKTFSEWCKNGPSGAKVSKITSKELPLHDYINFIIKR